MDMFIIAQACKKNHVGRGLCEGDWGNPGMWLIRNLRILKDMVWKFEQQCTSSQMYVGRMVNAVCSSHLFLSKNFKIDGHVGKKCVCFQLQLWLSRHLYMEVNCYCQALTKLTRTFYFLLYIGSKGTVYVPLVQHAVYVGGSVWPM